MGRLLLYCLFINLVCFGLCFLIVSFNLVYYGWTVSQFSLYVIKNVRFYFMIIGMIGIAILQLKR